MKKIIVTLVKIPLDDGAWLSHKVFEIEKTKYQSFPWGITIVWENSVLSIPWQQVRMVEEIIS